MRDKCLGTLRTRAEAEEKEKEYMEEEKG